jgi:RNA polymerase sigma factor (sigma-70 family)
MMKKVKEFEQYTDTEIISKVLSGETGLYEIIIRRYNPYLFKTGRSYGFSHTDTEDLIQETYLSAYTHLGSFENRSSFKTWLVRIMLNYCYQRTQKFSFQKETPTDNFIQEDTNPMFTSNHSDTDRSVINKELGHVLENALQQIPADYRMVFSLRELSGMNTAETAEALEISESNVKVRLNRAKEMLRTRIEKMYSPEDIFEFNLVYCDSMVERVMQKIHEYNSRG